MGNLTGRSALVTGSTSNIGRAIAIGLAAAGAHVVVSGRDEARGTAVVDRIRAAGGRADLVVADLDGSPARSRALGDAALAVVGGRLDILVNNAGIYPSAVDAPVADGADFDRTYGVNVKAPFFLTHHLAPGMPRGSSVVNLGSWVARLGLPGDGLYPATKAALESLTRSWAAQYGPAGVRVNAVAPGVIRPPEVAAGDFPGDPLMATAPAGDSGAPEAIAAAVLYLVSDDAAFVHGTVVDVDGGRAAVHLSAQG